MSSPAENTGTPLDHAGLRRGRRAFRYSVAACVFFGFALWFAEGYLRFDRAETQYRMSLTLHEASARPVLRNVVKRDAEANDPPNAKYVEALAAVEEPDMVLTVYEQAMRLNPRSSFLIINYGCALFLADRPAEARERFREALPYDRGMWARARGWALWKALLMLALDLRLNPAERTPRQVIDDVLAEHAATG